MRDITISISIDCTTLKLLQENAYLLSEISSLKDFNRVVDEKRALQMALSEQNVRLNQEFNNLKRGLYND